MKPFRNHPDVPAEVEASARWYEEREDGLGVEFVIAVERAVEQVCDAPRAWPRWSGVPDDLDVRRFTMRRFPFLIAYLDEPDEIVVLAVAHAKRRPMYWLHRGRHP